MLLRTALTGLLFLGILSADDQHDHGAELGSAHFPVSCTPAAQKTFDRGVALLHSFWYDEAEKTFSEATRIDPSCAMGYWGIAMSLYHPVWAPPTQADLKKGMAAVEKAGSLRAKTERERDYIATIGAFYRDWDKVDSETCYRSGDPGRKRTALQRDHTTDYAAGSLSEIQLPTASIAHEASGTEVGLGLLRTRSEVPTCRDVEAFTVV
jgi:hypothetical protein